MACHLDCRISFIDATSRTFTGLQHFCFHLGITLCAKKLMQKCSDVFIIDHAWSSDGSSVAKKQLETIPQLLSRMQSMFGIVDFEDDETNEINNEDDIDSVDLICELCNCPADQARFVYDSF